MPGRFLPHIQRRQIKAKGFRQPDQILQFPLRRRLVAMREQRITDQVQVFEKLGFSTVAPEGMGRRLGMAFDVRPNPFQLMAQAMIDQEAFTPVRFLGVLQRRIRE